MPALTMSRPVGEHGRRSRRLARIDLESAVAEIAGRHPAVGLALGVVDQGGLASFHGHGLADVATRTPVTEDTVFRIGSVTKLVTAIAVMQLGEQGLIDLDRPAGAYLRAYPLLPAGPGISPPTVRHLLSHTAGIPEVRGLADLRHSDLTPSGGRPALLNVRAGEPLPSLAEYYRDGLRVVVEPGTAFAYSNHGFATLGQIVEDVTGRRLGDVFRERIFEPLGMTDTDLVRSERVGRRLATGYAFGRSGPEPVPDRDWLGAGGGGVYSTTRDMAAFAAAVLGGGANEHGRILEALTLATMFEPAWQPHPRIPGIGLAFFRGDVAGHRTVGHDGILPGFNSALLVAPDDGVGIVAFTNGSSGAFSWLQVELDRLLRALLDLPDEVVGSAVPHHPEIWADLCGRYVFAPRISDLRGRIMLAGGAEVFVRGGRLMVRLRIPIPALFRGLPLEPDDPSDPSVFRLDLSPYGMAPLRVGFARDPRGRVVAAHTDLAGQPWSLVRRDDPEVPAAWSRRAAAGAAAATLVVAARRLRQRRASR